MRETDTLVINVHTLLNRLVLKQQKEAKLEGVRYPCDQCQFSSTCTCHLKRHKKVKLETMRYLCYQCDFAAKEIKTLKRNNKGGKHEGIRYL